MDQPQARPATARTRRIAVRRPAEVHDVVDSRPRGCRTSRINAAHIDALVRRVDATVRRNNMLVRRNDAIVHRIAALTHEVCRLRTLVAADMSAMPIAGLIDEDEFVVDEPARAPPAPAADPRHRAAALPEQTTSSDIEVDALVQLLFGSNNAEN
jgi:hypothetical protein